MVLKYFAHVVFWTTTLLSLVSIALLFILGDPLLVLLAASAGYNVWALRRNESRGFVPTQQMRRAYEPSRHFNLFQVLFLFVVLMVQGSLAVYFVVT